MALGLSRVSARPHTARGTLDMVPADPAYVRVNCCNRIGRVPASKLADPFASLMWSRHCSRAIPAVLGYDPADNKLLRVLRQPETVNDVVRFWS